MDNKRIVSLLRLAIDLAGDGGMMPFSEKEYKEMEEFLKEVEENKLLSYEDVENHLKYSLDMKRHPVDIYRSFQWKFNNSYKWRKD